MQVSDTMTRHGRAAIAGAMLALAAGAALAQNATPPSGTTIPERIEPPRTEPSVPGQAPSVIRPPMSVDPGIHVPAPEPTPNTTPVIPPPGAPGGDPRIQPR